MTRAMRVWPLIATCAALACGSGGSESTVNRDTLTQRQKDSILANSRIPGASGVGKAMRAADSTSARIQRANAMATDTLER